MLFKYTILYVENAVNCLDFYSEAFGLDRGFVHESGDYGELVTGSTKLAFSSRHLMRELGKNPAPPNPDAPQFELAFETDDVDAALARALKAGASLVQASTQEEWGQITAYVRDLEGFLVEICTPIGSA